MNIFLDTEFSNFTDYDLISIGMVAEDGRTFYGERQDFELAACNAFVKKAVLPQLGKRPESLYIRSGLAKAVRHWLQQFEREAPVICYDFDGDWLLLEELLAPASPAWLQHRNIHPRIDDLLVERWFMLHGVPDHHALHDALANRYAYREMAALSP